MTSYCGYFKSDTVSLQIIKSTQQYLRDFPTNKIKKDLKYGK